MDSISAFAKGAASRGRESMVFDWDEAARRIIAKGAKFASAGLRDDWEWTGGGILVNGKPDMESYTFLSSTWATPELRIGDEEPEACFKMKSETPEWDSRTKWPESALIILRGTHKEPADE